MLVGFALVIHQTLVAVSSEREPTQNSDQMINSPTQANFTTDDGLIEVHRNSDDIVCIYDVKADTVMWGLVGHPGWIWQCTLSPNDRVLTVGTDQGMIVMWSLITGQCLQVLSPFPEEWQPLRRLFYRVDQQLCAHSIHH